MSTHNTEMVVSQNGGHQYRPQNIIVLIIGTLKMVPLILGNYQMGMKKINSMWVACRNINLKLGKCDYNVT